VQSRPQLNPKLPGEASPARQQHRLPEYSGGGVRASSPMEPNPSRETKPIRAKVGAERLGVDIPGETTS
jgi:hypothetical protein